MILFFRTAKLLFLKEPKKIKDQLMMKFLWALTITIVSSTILFVQPVFSQFTDGFADGDFILNPNWSGQDSHFTASAHTLQLQGPAEAGSSFLSIECKAINDASWEFNCILDFNPSGSNYARVYLVSDQPDLTSSLNGYYILIGGTADEISLYRQSGATQTKIIDGEDGRVDLGSVQVRVKTTRDGNGNWELHSDVGLTGTYVLEGSGTDVTHISSQYFGVYCAYTSTRSDKFSFDDFVVTGSPMIDNTTPAYHKDVIITEILADPSPSVGLPEVEFLEILNRSSNEFNLNNWTVSDGSSTASLSGKNILPGGYLLVVPSSSKEMFPSVNAMGVTNFPSLNNAGDKIVLKSADGITIDSVQYSDVWYKDSQKKEGGWSLELIDPANPCGEEENWIASEDETGGTPGRQNSVYANKPDVKGPSLKSVFADTPTTITLTFDEKLAQEEVDVTSIQVEPHLEVIHVQFSDATLRNLVITLNEPLQFGELYRITINRIRDCNLNLVDENQNTLSFALPEEADSVDVIINEILFDPLPMGADFVELYNKSGKYLNLKNWKLANVEDNSVTNLKNIVEGDRLFFPGSYLAITDTPEAVVGHYTNSVIENFIKTELPSLPDDEGSIALINNNGKIIDLFIYTDELHSPLIKNEEGVSLERVSFSTATNDPQNWNSASTSVGYASPGYINSNSLPDRNNAKGAIHVDPEIFQPVYGNPSYTLINYQFDQGGYVANVKIFDSQGRPIKVLANNELIGTEGFYRWDGDRDDGSKARIGYYFVWFEVFDLSGNLRTYRNRIVVAAQF